MIQDMELVVEVMEWISGTEVWVPERRTGRKIKVQRGTKCRTCGKWLSAEDMDIRRGSEYCAACGSMIRRAS